MGTGSFVGVGSLMGVGVGGISVAVETAVGAKVGKAVAVLVEVDSGNGSILP
jgi:hypothetical protein